MSLLRRTTLIAAPVLLAAGAAGWWVRAHAGPPAPLPANLAQADPEIAALIQDAASAVASHRGDVERRLHLGLAYEANNYFPHAALCYEQVLEQDAGQVQAWYRLAVCRERDGDLDGAIEAMRRATRCAGDLPPAHLRLAFWLLDAGDLDGAELAVASAGQLNPQGRGQRIAEARLHLERDDARGALDLIEKHGLTEGRGGTFAAHLLARAHRMLGDADAARSVIAAIGDRPASGGPDIEDPWARQLSALRAGTAPRLRQAGALIAAGRHAQAIESLEALYVSDPDEVRLQIMLAQCFLATKRPSKALHWVDNALSVAPDHFGSNVGYARVAVQLGTRTGSVLERALRCADHAVQLRPTSGDAHDTRGSVLYALGREDEALDAWRAAWRLDSRSPAPLLRIGTVQLGRNEWEAARTTFSEVLERFDDDALPFICRARAEMELGDLDQAESTLAAAQKAGNANTTAMLTARARLRELRTP